MIPYGRQDITEDDVKAVEQVLRSDFLTQGPVVPRFETAIAEYCRASYGVAVNSATSALHIACQSLDLGPGDWVWTSPNSFVASANCARYCGANVDFVDIDPQTYNISVECLAVKLRQAKRSGKAPKAIIVVHFAGQPCDLGGVRALADQYGFRIIEDASHAIGARYHDEAIGSCRYSDITVFSFHPVKIITTAEGGVATTNDLFLAQRMISLRSHGITRDVERMQSDSEGPWYYEQQELGYNYRMTDIQAALGLSQLQRLNSYIEERHVLANRYDKLLAELPITLPYRNPDYYPSLHLYPIQLMGRNERFDVFNALRAFGIGVNVHYIPVHTHPDYQRLGFKKGDFPIAEAYYDRAISLPIFPRLKTEEQDRVIECLKNLLSNGSIQHG